MQKNHSILRVNHLIKYSAICILVFWSSCSSDSAQHTKTETFELQEYDTIVAYEDNLLAEPTVLTYDESFGILVFDHGMEGVQQFSKNGTFQEKIGEQGRGPGEYFMLNNIIVRDESLYFIDFARLLIHQYDNQGNHVSSFDYGQMGYVTSPSPPITFGSVAARDLAYQPHVTAKGELLLSPLLASEMPDFVFDLVSWEGELLSNIGELPEGSGIEMDPAEHRNALSDGDIPPIDKVNVIPVSDLSNLDQFFLVYTAFPRIEMYNMSGEKLWRSDIKGVPEIEDVAQRYYDVMETLSPAAWISLNKYMSGVSSPDGELFLATNTNPELPGPLWIHRFDNKGKLIARYNIKSEVNIPPVFDIDFENNRIFVITEEAEIRAYTF